MKNFKIENSEKNLNWANLTKSQLETYNSLVRLGDSKKLALKTTLEQNELSADDYKMYQQAYYS